MRTQYVTLKKNNRVYILRDCVLIVWDECTTAHRKSVEAVDHTLQDIRLINLLLVTRDTRADEINVYLDGHLYGPILYDVLLGGKSTGITQKQLKAQKFSGVLSLVGYGTITEVNI